MVYQLRELLNSILYDQQIPFEIDAKCASKDQDYQHLAESILERYSTAECAIILDR